MKKIIIVEDELNIRSGLVKIVREIDEDITIFETGYAEEALEIAKREDLDLFFLDVQLEDYSGYELAKEIRELSEYKLTPIVFISAFHSIEMEAYRNVHCYSFIYKPFAKDDIRKVFQEIKTGLISSKDNKMIKFKEKEFTYLINQEDIIYIEAKNRKVFVKTQNEMAVFSYIPIAGIIQQLSKDFVQCHKSYIINKSYIKRIDKLNSGVDLNNSDQMIPVGRKYKDELWRIY